MSHINIMDHQGLVHTVVNGYFDVGAGTVAFSREDAMQSGNIGLLKAAAKYDPAKGAFSTYAMYWIRDSIQEALDNSSRTISIPRHVRRAAHAKGFDYPREGTSLDDMSIVPDAEDTAEIAYSAPDQDSAACDNQVGRDIKSAMASLTANERFVLEQIYFKETTQKVVAARLGVTREWVRLLEKSALKKMKESGYCVDE